jgi:HTH-type transcriptional regulator/antitoxin HigA
LPSKILVKAIRNDRDYEAALARVDTLIDAKKNTPDGDELDILVTLIEAYEAKHHPITPPDPVETIKFRMDQMGYGRDKLAALLGGQSRVSELFAGKRSLTLSMIRKLHREWNIPADVLIGEK